MSRHPTIPHSLRAISTVNKPADTIVVGLSNLYHHYYLDTYGRSPPSPDPAQFEHSRFLLPTAEFRFQGSGIGDSPESKRSRSNDLGRAFCRWFLYEHFNVTYFAHLSQILNRQLHRAFGGLRVARETSGDTPDYFCAESVDRICLAEAKGRYTAISFNNKEFGKWRRQFERVVVTDSSGKPVTVKGHIVATRFATEHDSPRLKTCISAEDPASPGDRPLGPDESRALGASIVALHYSGIAEKLRQPILAVALASGVPMPSELRVQAIAWEIVAGPLVNRRFVGGYFPGSDGEPNIIQENGRMRLQRHNPLRLDSPTATFFGLEERIFRKVVRLARGEASAGEGISHFEETAFFYSGFSVLRDGTAIGPVEFFSPIEPIVI